VEGERWGEDAWKKPEAAGGGKKEKPNSEGRA